MAKIGATRGALAIYADSGVGSAVKALYQGFSCLAALPLDFARDKTGQVLSLSKGLDSA